MRRRYQLVRQNDGNDCGAAALATLALHHRRPVGLEQLRQLTSTDRSGATLLGLLRAAERLGFSAKAVRCGYESLAALPLPAIAHLADEQGNGHFVVVYRLTKRGLIVADPIGKVGELPRESFCRQWSGALLLAAPDASADAARRPEGDQSSPWRRFLQLMRPHRAILAEVVVCALLMALLAVTTSLFVQHLVDSVLVRREAALLNALGVGMTCIALFRALFGALRQYLLAHVGRRIDLALMSRYMRHVLALPMQFFETRRAGEVLARITDAAKLREAVSGAATAAIVDVLVVAALLAVLWLYDVQLAAATLAAATTFLLAVALNHKAARQRSSEAMENGAQLSAHFIEDVGGVETIKAFGAESRRGEQGESRLVAFAQSLFALQKLDLRVGSLGTLITGLSVVAILWFGGHRVMAGALSIGQLLFFYTLLATMLEPLNRLATVNLKLQEALVAVDRLFQVLDLEVEAPGGGKARLERICRGIELQDVSFSYGSRGVVLDRLNLVIPAGATVALVGESGSGKSTLLKLLQAFYEPSAGRVLVDGDDLRDLDLADYRGRIGVVSQDPFVFNGTIRQNLALARPDAPLSEIMAVARAAGLDEFINRLPQRYETIVGERGANLSGGQRQRMAIARALLRQPDILIFDEATSHLDTATEQAIQENLRGALAGKTVVLVAHRLSTVRHADQIYVLHEGRVAEQGAHGELLAAGGRYADLWKSQAADAAEPSLRLDRLGPLTSIAPPLESKRFNGANRLPQI